MTLPIAPAPLFGAGVDLLYLSNATIPYNPPTSRGTWDDNAPVTTSKMAIVPAGASTFIDQGEGGLQGTQHTTMIIKFGTSALQANVTISGTLSFCLAMGYVNSIGSEEARMHIFVTQGSTDTVRGTILTNFNYADITSTYRGVYGNVGLVTVNALAGDHIIFELGCRFSSGSGDTTIREYYGNTGSVLLGDEDTNVTTRPAWFRFLNTDLPLIS